MKYIKYAFYIESAISLFSAAQALFIPALFLQQFGQSEPSILALEIARWYGVTVAALVFLLLQGLRMRGPALKLALQALLFGDVLQIAATFVTAKAFGGWSFTLIMSAVLSTIYLLVRAICLWKPVETETA